MNQNKGSIIIFVMGITTKKIKMEVKIYLLNKFK
jgi:hypothetical protein